eukprot:TRINITY_DN9932_c0_g1_i1.p1 TRINITY_DN9932_c0_g1~~TRINITY_DN9932_c0_g1_i1.p1  ORF type:complete len:509 (+),score=68.22 TRINITY_DN9932_c0_g1_i1:26-1552(+)
MRAFAGVAVLFLVCYVQHIRGIMKVDTSTQMIVDEYGRTRLFHGVNAVFKVPPYHPITDKFDPQLSITAVDIANLEKWGFNFIRLGMMWPGVAPAKNKYNETYMNIMTDLINDMGKAGIYTLVDAHQDVLSRKFCGEGAPDWAVYTKNQLPFPIPARGLTTTYPVNGEGYPPLDICLNDSFAFYYFSEAASSAFQALYDDTDGIQGAFGDFWNQVSKQYATNDYVLGYELINEPWVGNIYLNPDLLVPGIADKENLMPMYVALNDVIRKNDNDHMIFFEKALIDQVSLGGFHKGPGGEAYNDRQVYSYHIYCAPLDVQGDPRYPLLCEAEEDLAAVLDLEMGKRLGCGMFLSEYGAMGNDSNAIQVIEWLNGWADQNLQSWAYWQFKKFKDLTTQGPGESFYGEDGNLQTNKVKALSRTYARAIAGVPTAMNFDPATSQFLLEYSINTGIKEPTEIYLNEEWYYPAGYNIGILPKGSVTVTSPKTNILHLTPASAANGAKITVHISKK